jgi:serine/threonine-protein kinase ATR
MTYRERTFTNSFLKVHQALKTLAMITERKPGNQKSSSKADKMLLTFLDNQLLGIMAHFSDILDVSRDRQTTAHKKRCLYAVETLIAISKGHINIALPQVC